MHVANSVFDDFFQKKICTLFDKIADTLSLFFLYFLLKEGTEQISGSKLYSRFLRLNIEDTRDRNIIFSHNSSTIPSKGGHQLRQQNHSR